MWLLTKYHLAAERFQTFDELTDHVSEEHIGSGHSEYVCMWENCERNGKPFNQRQKVMRHIQTRTYQILFKLYM